MAKKKKIFRLNILNRILKFALRQKSLFFFSMTCSIVLSLISSLRAYITMITIDEHIKTKTKEGFLIMISFIFIILLLEVILQFLFIYTANLIGQQVIKNIRIELFEKILQFKLSYFRRSSVGRLVSRVVSDVETIAQFFSQGLFMIINDLLKMLVIAILMIITDWKLSLISFSILSILIYVTKIFQEAIKSAFQEVRVQVANLNGFVQERITGMKILQLFNREDIEYEKFQKINRDHKTAHIKTVWYFSIFYPIAEFLSSIAIGILVWFSGKELIQNADISEGKIIGFIIMTEMLFKPLRHIADRFTTLQMGIVAGKRVFKIIDMNTSLDQKGSYKPQDIRGNISFKNVFFNYKDDEPILKGISFDIKQGETVAIVGSTGAGKSTIINLINCFYDVKKGMILIDDLPIETYDLTFLRKKIAVVLQDVFLFSDSILNNIRLQREEISIDEIKTAIKEIEIDDFINRFPGKLEYNVKERGIMLSSGERQLIAFLRAYISKPSILVLDEATSSIDSHSEKMIQRAIDKITKNRTSIIIAHRLSTVENADKIIVLEKGKIIEIGKHDDLLKIRNGCYKNLYEKQFLS